MKYVRGINWKIIEIRKKIYEKNKKNKAYIVIRYLIIESKFLLLF